MRFRETVQILTDTAKEMGCVPVARELIRRLAHDLNNPLGTLTLELFSQGELHQSLRRSIAQGDTEDALAALDELTEIHDNLVRSQERAAAIVGTLRDAAAQLGDEAGEGLTGG